MNVDANLYDFLKENETGLFRRKDEVIAFVHVDFCDIKEFIEIVGSSHFSEHDVDVILCDKTICIELNDIIEGLGHYLSSYKRCFHEYDDYFSKAV